VPEVEEVLHAIHRGVETRGRVVGAVGGVLVHAQNSDSATVMMSPGLM